MKKIVLVFVVLCSAAAFGQISPGVPVQVLPCTTHTDVTNTGDTSAHVVVSCGNLQNQIPVSGRIVVQADVESCTSAATPFAACAGINTGTCNMLFGFNSTAGGTSSLKSTGALTAATGSQALINFSNRAATNSQIITGYQVKSGGSIAIFSSGVSSQDTTTATYLNIILQNSVGADICGVRDVTVTLWSN